VRYPECILCYSRPHTKFSVIRKVSYSRSIQDSIHPSRSFIDDRIWAGQLRMFSPVTKVDQSIQNCPPALHPLQEAHERRGLESEVSVPKLREWTRLLHTRCLRVCFYYPTRQNFLSGPRTRFIDNNRRLRAKHQLCKEQEVEQLQSTRAVRIHRLERLNRISTRSNPEGGPVNSPSHMGFLWNTFSSVCQGWEPTLVPPTHPRKKEKHTCAAHPPSEKGKAYLGAARPPSESGKTYLLWPTTHITHLVGRPPAKKKERKTR